MSNFKKLVNARMAKTGENWQTAQRAVRAQIVSPIMMSGEHADAKADTVRPTISTDPVDALIASLRSVHIGSILVGRIPAVGTSATASVAAERARDLAEHPKHFAQSASVQMTISLAHMHALITRGATEKYGVQRIRVFRYEDSQTTFSVPCANCDRWIWCGHDEHAGACKCGQKYEITFDGPVDWSLPQGWLCMNCGEPFKVTEVSESRSPWHAMNERQQACDICFHMQHVGAWWVRKRAGEAAAKVDLDARHSAISDAVTKHGEASSRVVTTQPIAGDAPPTDPRDPAALVPMRVRSDAGQPPSPLDLGSNPYDMAVVGPFGVRELRLTQNRTTGKVERVGLYMGETPSNERLLDLARLAKTTWSDVEISIIGLPQANGYSYELWATDWTRRWAQFGKSLADHYGVPPEALAGL